jgi:flavin reductase (DIM6/NTAB) family NADH-FMN oxidoreductase RutF
LSGIIATLNRWATLAFNIHHAGDPMSALCALPPDFDAAYFRSALSQFATGVTVVITHGADGTFHGLTVNSFSSVSLDPPLVLWSLANKARSMAAFRECSHYIINLLAEDQVDLALRFSRQVENRFESLKFDTSRTGLPILDGVAAWFECQNRSRYQEGDHHIFVGQVERCQMKPSRTLGFHGGRFVAI